MTTEHGTGHLTAIGNAFQRVVHVCMRYRLVWCTHGASNQAMAGLFTAVEELGRMAAPDAPPPQAGSHGSYDRQLHACLRALVEQVDPAVAGYQEYMAFTAQYRKARRTVYKCLVAAGRSAAADRVGLTDGRNAMARER